MLFTGHMMRDIEHARKARFSATQDPEGPEIQVLVVAELVDARDVRVRHPARQFDLAA